MTHPVTTRQARAALLLVSSALLAPGCTEEVTDPFSDGAGSAVRGATLQPSAGTMRATVVATAPVGVLVNGLNDAGFALWRTQPAAQDLIFSPMSIGHALLMARAAADEARS